MEGQLDGRPQVRKKEGDRCSRLTDKRNPWKMGEVTDGRPGQSRMRGQRPRTLQFPRRDLRNGRGRPAYLGSWSSWWKWSFAIQAFRDSDIQKNGQKDHQGKEFEETCAIQRRRS